MNIWKITHAEHQSILSDLFDQAYAKSTMEGVHVTGNLIYQYAIMSKYQEQFGYRCQDTYLAALSSK
jgi:hypothetical protein